MYDIKTERKILWILAAIQFTHIVDFMVMMPLASQLMHIFGIDTKQFGILVSSYTFAAGTTGILGAMFLDRINRKTALLVSYAGFTIGTLGCGLAPTYESLLITRALTGAFGGLLSSLVLSTVADVTPFERRGSAMGVITAAFSVAATLGVPFSIMLANKFNWHAPFFALGAAAVLVWIGIAIRLPRPTTQVSVNKNVFTPYADVFRDPNRLIAVLFYFFLVMGQFCVIPFIAPTMVSNVGFTQDNLPIMYFLGGLATIFTSPMIGRMADRSGRLWVFSVMLFVSLIPLVVVTHLGRIPLPLALIVTTLFFITVGGRMVPAQTIMSSAVAPQHRGSFFSIASSAQQFSAAAASFVAGLIVYTDSNGVIQNYPYVGYLAVFSSLLAFLCARKISARDRDIPAQNVTPTEARA